MKTTVWKSMISALFLGLFLWLASGSLGIPEFGTESPEKTKDVYSEDVLTKEKTFCETTTGNAFLGGKFKKEVVGKQDTQGRWHGYITTLYSTWNAEGKETLQEAESGSFYHGIRNGQFLRTILLPERKEVIMCFNMGVLVNCPKSELALKENPTAFSLLMMKYTWYPYLLNMMEIDNHQIMSFMDAVEAELTSHQFEADSFNSYYENAVTAVSANQTHKSTAGYINFVAMEESADLIRGNEFRLAILEHFRSSDIRTFNILKTTYPGYLNLLIQAGGSEDDARHFCVEIETRMLLGGTFDTESPFFTDSVDFRLAKTLFELMFEEKSISDILHLGRHIIQSGEYHLMPSVKPLFESRLTKSPKQLSPQDISYIVVYTMLMEIEKGDLVRRAVREATFYGRTQLAIVTTSEPGINQANGIELTGNVIEDGGAEVTHRGIAWDTSYNPTIDNNTVAMGSGSGKFTVTLTNLAEGQTYYARAYATNSEGTAYGNVIGFSLSQQTAVSNLANQDERFSVYPIPARGQLYVMLENLPGETSTVSLMNLKGQQLRSRNTDLPGQHEVNFNIEGLAPGIYIVHVNRKGQSLTRRVIVE